MDAPTGAARWFNKLDIDFNVSSESVVQTFDVSDMSTSSSYYRWWVQNTKPTHPVLADSQRKLIRQLGVTEGWPNVVVVGCDGEVKFSRHGEMTQAMHDEVWDVIDAAAKEPACAQQVPDKP